MQSIEKLSHDGLIEVLSHLDIKSLQAATLVCKEWNGVIGASPKLMKIFNLRLDNTYDSSLRVFIPWDEKYDEILKLERSYQSIYISWNVPCETALKVIEKFGSQIRKLSINNGKFLKANVFQEVLKRMPLLEELEVKQTEFNLEDIEAIYPAQLKMLKSLKITFGTSWSIFRYLVGSQPKYLEISPMKRIQSDTDTQFLMTLLKATKRLETLKCGEAFIHNVFKHDESRFFSFQLKSLEFFYKAASVDSEDTVARFCKFLKSNASSLDNLDMWNSSEKIFEAAFNHCKKLKKLNLNTADMPANMEFYENLTPLEKLLELDCSDFITSEDAAKGLLGICPNIKSMKVYRDQIFSNLTPFMARYNPNIESLKLDNIKDEIDGDVKFKALKLLYVNFTGNDESMKLFIKTNPTIETFGLRMAMESDIVDFLLTMPNIRHLKFGGEVVCMKEIFDKIVLAGVKHLETLEIIFEKVLGRPNVIFELPADSEQWDSKCPFLKDYVKSAQSEFRYKLDVRHISEF